MLITQKIFKIFIWKFNIIWEIYRLISVLKNILNWLIISTVIGANVHTHFPQFTTSLDLDIYLYIYPTPIMYKSILYIRGKQKFTSVQTLLLPHLYTLNKIKCIKLSSINLYIMCSIPHGEIPATKHFH